MDYVGVWPGVGLELEYEVRVAEGLVGSSSRSGAWRLKAHSLFRQFNQSHFLMSIHTHTLQKIMKVYFNSKSS